MRAKDIKVGGIYVAKVSNKLTKVWVDAIEDRPYGSGKAHTAYHVINLTTGCKTTFLSAAKFRSETDHPKPLEEREREDFDSDFQAAEETAQQIADSIPTKERQGLFRHEVAASEDIRRAAVEEVLEPMVDSAQRPCDCGMFESDPSDDNRCRQCGGFQNEVATCPFVEPTTTTDAGATTASSEGEQGSDPTDVQTVQSTWPHIGTSVTGVSNDEEGRHNQNPTTPPVTVPVVTLPTDSAPDAGERSTPVAMIPAAHTAMEQESTRLISGLAAKLGNTVYTLPPDSVVQTPNGKLYNGRKPTEEQKAILDAAPRMLREKSGVLVIEAGAGAGKTSTLEMLEQELPGIGQYTAFNSSLCAESKGKFKRCQVNTTHSLAFRAEGKRFAHRLGGNRVRSEEIAQRLGIEGMMLDMGFGEDGQPRTKRLAAGFLAGQVMKAIARFCQSADREPMFSHFRKIDGIDVALTNEDGEQIMTRHNSNKVRDYLLPFAVKAWADLSSPEGTLPFSHDCYVKTWQLGRPYIAADYILLDEDQDTAEVMVDILKRQTHALLVLVGDENQSIYSWRGAVNATRAFPDAPRLWLSQSFRFGQRIADVANSILGTLAEKTQLNLKGLSSIPSRVLVDGAETLTLRDADCVLCRTNAAAVKTVLDAKSLGLSPCLIGGKNYVSELASWFRAAKDLQGGRTVSHTDLCLFSTWAEVEEYAGTDEGEDLKLNVKLVEEFGCDTILSALDRMPAEKDADLAVCTSHKSKGREWGKVILAADFPTADKLDDEARRLLYVAATRAKYVLDISRCPPFTMRTNKEGDPIPVIKLNWTVEQPSKEQTEQYIRSKREGGADVKPSSPAVNGLESPAESPKAQEGAEYRHVPPPSGNTSIVPVKPVEFTWSKGKSGDWLIRGPAGYSGKSVEVSKRDGRKSRETLGKVIWEGDGVALYAVGSSGSKSFSSGSNGSSNRKVCAECGKPGYLVSDLEDGLMKHRNCCDIAS